MTRLGWLRLTLGAGVLVLLVARLGTGPFTAGLHALDRWSLLAALAVTVATTACGAWRWRLVAHGLGLELPLCAAVAASYRAQLLNSTLPGGVVGDVHRGVRHGRTVRHTGRALRAVAWEWLWGQVAQVAVAVVVLVALPSPVRSSMPHVLLVAVVVVPLAALAVPLLVPVVRCDLRALLGAGTIPGVLLLSLFGVAGHVTVFLIAARTAGVDGSPHLLLPLAMLVLLAMAVPANVAGWGPREGVAAWAFGSVGLGSSAGVETAVVYGVLVLVASLPGTLVLVVETVRRHVVPVTELEVGRG
jgi:hypothetical protein